MNTLITVLTLQNNQYSTLMSLPQFLLPIALLVITTANLEITPLTTHPIVAFGLLERSLIGALGKAIYTVQFSIQTKTTSINAYQLTNGQLSLSGSFTGQSKVEENWQLIEVGPHIVALPMEVDGNITILERGNLSLVKSFWNGWGFLNVIAAQKYNLIFLSTNHGSIYYTQKSNPYESFALLQDSNHIGNTYVTLSPDNLYLCSTDQFTGFLTLWSVPNQQKLYEFKTSEKGIRAHTWNIDSKTIYAFGYSTGLLYQFSINDSIQLFTQTASSLRYVTSCFYFYETNEIVAFSYNLSAVVSFSLRSNSFSKLLVFQGAQKIQFEPTLKYFSIFNKTAASYYAVSSKCASNQYLNLATYQCLPCGSGCLACNPNVCYFCQEGFSLSADSFNCSQPTQPNNASNSSNTTVIHYRSSILNLTTTYVFNTTLDFINATFQIPGHRQFLNIFFELFSSFDHLVLFIYHNRTFGPNMEFYLKLIHSTIDYRFNIINNQLCQKYLGIDFNQWQANIDFKYNFSYPKFVQIQQNGEGLFVNNLQYFFLNIPLILLSVGLAKSFFHLFFNFSFSVFLRKFQFLGIIAIMLLEGNVQFFFFSFAGDFLTLFSPNYSFKLYNVATVLAGWLFLCLSTVGLFCLYLLYKKHSKFLLQNCKGTFGGSLYFLTVNGIMNILRGIIHRVLITEPKGQAIALMVLELKQICVHIYSSKRFGVIQSTFLLVLFVVSNVSRVIFNFSLLFQSESNLLVLDQIHTSVIFTAIILIFLGMVYSLNELLTAVKRLIMAWVQKCRSKNRVSMGQTSNAAAIQLQSLEKHQKNQKDRKAQPQFKYKVPKQVNFGQNQMIRDKNSVKTTRVFKRADHETLCGHTRKVKKAKVRTDPSKYLSIVLTNRQLVPQTSK